MEAAPSGEVLVEGRRLAWRASGEGPALLLVNGYASTGADWDPNFLAALSAGRRLICPDNRGLGGSELGEGELTIDGMAADLEALLDGLGIERAPLVGWSMGGFVAQRLAARAPHRVEALTLIASDPGGAAAVPAEAAVWAQMVDHSGDAPRTGHAAAGAALPGAAGGPDRRRLRRPGRGRPGGDAGAGAAGPGGGDRRLAR